MYLKSFPGSFRYKKPYLPSSMRSINRERCNTPDQCGHGSHSGSMRSPKEPVPSGHAIVHPVLIENDDLSTSLENKLIDFQCPACTKKEQIISEYLRDVTSCEFMRNKYDKGYYKGSATSFITNFPLLFGISFGF